MALFAMLAVLTSPVLAFACCCQTQAAASDVLIHEGCEGHEGALAAHRPSSPSSHAQTTPQDGPCLQNVCSCVHSDISALVINEGTNASVFSPLVLGVPIQVAQIDFQIPSAVKFAFASNAARPRGPSASHQTGRAPPVVSL